MKLQPPVPRSLHASRLRSVHVALGTDRTVTHPVDDPFMQGLTGVPSVGELAAQVPEAGPRRNPRILVVNADPFVLRRIDADLAGEGYRVVAVSSFQYAKQSLESVAPDLLVADIRLQAYNGLHLALRSRVDHPSLPVIITNAWHDPVLETQARRLGAAYVVDPAGNPEFLKHVRAAFDESRQVNSTIHYR